VQLNISQQFLMFAKLTVENWHYCTVLRYNVCRYWYQTPYKLLSVTQW